MTFFFFFLVDGHATFSPVFTIFKKQKSKRRHVHTKSPLVLLECNLVLRPCLREVVLSGFVVANHQVSGSPSVEGMK